MHRIRECSHENEEAIMILRLALRESAEADVKDNTQPCCIGE